MKVEVTDLSPVKKRMSVEVDTETVGREADTILRGYAREAKIPGFRPGKAPLSVVRGRYAKEIEDDIRERVVARYYVEAAREHKLQPLGNPVLDELHYHEGEPLRFQTTFEILPEIELKSYKDVEVRRRTPKVDAEEVDKFLESLRQSRTQLISEEGAESATGHILVADLDGTPEEGEPFQHERTMIEVGHTEHLPTFNEQLMGLKAGDEREFSLEYPKEYGNPEIAGKTVSYRIKIHEIKRKEVPELDDEFAKDLGDFEDLAALRKRIEDDLVEKGKQEAEQELRQSILDKVLTENPIVLPEILVQDEIRQQLERLVRNMMMQGVDPEQAKIDWEQLRKQQEEPARKAVHAKLILDAVAAAESVEIDPAEVQERIRVDAAQMGEKPEKLLRELEKHGGVETLKSQMVRAKSLDLLTAVANIQGEE